MEFLLNLLTFMFVALVLGLAITIGFSLLLWCLAAGLLLSLLLMLRQRWQRWRFVRANEPAAGDIRVIEGVYTEITEKRRS